MNSPPPADATQEPSNDITEQEFTRVTDDMAVLFDTVYDPVLLDPVSYIHAQIRTIVDESGADQALKDKTNASTAITVESRPPTSAGSGLIDGSALLRPPSEHSFPLSDIVTDSYRRRLAAHRNVKVRWPSNFPQDLIRTLESANLQSAYQSDVDRRLNSPQAKVLMQLQATIEVEKRLTAYLNRAETLPHYKQLIQAWQREELQLELVEFKSRATRRNLAQVLYLRPGKPAPYGGLLIFLDAEDQDAIVPLPEAGRRWFIENSSKLRRLILQRLPLFQQLKSDNQKLVYQPFLVGPMIFSPPAAPLQFRPASNVFKALCDLKIEKMLSDIDTLVSTDSERLTDKILEVGIFILQGLAIAVTVPSGGGVAVRVLVSFLLGLGAAALEAVRGTQADTPQEAQERFQAAALAAVTEIAGPLAQKLLRKALSAATRARINKKLFDHIVSKYKPLGQPLITTTVKPAPVDIKRVKSGIIGNLSRGPEHAQRWVEQDARLLNRTVEGHDLVIYRGKVFRGDMRPPEEIFDKGFELRTPAAEIQKDIHQVTGVRGGFGGGHDALDLDGKGISTSAYYYKDNVGAFVYGGQKGGHTYVIDGRKLDGYHLYQNHHNALYPNAQTPIQFKPSEINYAHNIPAEAVLGAYDAAGAFIPNHAALKKYARAMAIKELRERMAAAATATASTAISKR
jgi:hypothetical protein